MTGDFGPEFERPALELTLREWLASALIVTAILAAATRFPFRESAPVVDRDYRIPYALSTRYDLYRRYTTLGAAQYPTLLVGDSVVWGQCARRDDTLAHHLNDLVRQPRFLNVGLDGMHPVALAELLQYHAPAIANTRVILQFDPLWLLMEGPSSPDTPSMIYNRPNLVPRLAAHFSGPFRDAASLSWSHLIRNSAIREWGERLADARLDFIAWSLDHPYENPVKAITAALPPSEDSHPQRLTHWDYEQRVPNRWADLAEDHEWAAFLRILTLLRSRGNNVLVLLGPMNEHMMTPETRDSYRSLRSRMEEILRSKGVPTFLPSLLPTEQFADICHPLGSGYATLAREMLQKQSAWLLGRDEQH